MDNILLGKTVKAMYKLSGKTLQQLSDETGLTVDTINNFFYARLQKPGYLGVCDLVRATGHTPEELAGFMEYAAAFPPDTDFTKKLAEYILAAEDTKAPVPSAEPHVPAETGAPLCDSCRTQLDMLNEQHEKQLDRFRATHLHYVEHLEQQYRDEIALLRRQNLFLTCSLGVTAVVTAVLALTFLP